MVHMFQEEIDFLKSKGLLKEGNTAFIIKGDFGEVNLVELLQDYGRLYADEHNQGEYGRKGY